MLENAIAVLDFGSTNIRTTLYNDHKEAIRYNYKKVKVISTKDGQYEMDALEVYQDVIYLLKNLFESVENISFNSIALGISCHRGSFLVWDRDTGKPLCNVISWQDSRCEYIVNSWNNSYIMKMFKIICKMIAIVGKSKRFSINQSFKFDTTHTIIRLHWLLITNPNIMNMIQSGNIIFGTLETWIIWKLTAGKKHITDISNVCATAMYHLISKNWSYEILQLFNIPTKILPEIVPTHGQILGIVDSSIFGFPFKIAASIADQQAALFGCGCNKKGDVKVTFGTGTFIDISTGQKPIALLENGFIPFIGRYDGKIFEYSFGSMQQNTSHRILSFMKIHNIENPEIMDRMAINITEYEKDSSIILINDFEICKEARNTLDQIIYEFYQLWINLKKTCPMYPFELLKANGGVSNSNYVLQTVSTLCQVEIHRMKDIESTSVGTMLLCCLTLGININDYDFLVDTIFKPGNIQDKLVIHSRMNSSQFQSK